MKVNVVVQSHLSKVGQKDLSKTSPRERAFVLYIENIATFLERRPLAKLTIMSEAPHYSMPLNKRSLLKIGLLEIFIDSFHFCSFLQISVSISAHLPIFRTEPPFCSKK